VIRTIWFSTRPSPNIFNRTLLTKYQTTLHPLLETRDLIDQTLLEKFQADLTQNFLSRPCYQKVKLIFLNRKTATCTTVGENQADLT